ncbi:MAG: diguanylate cyclase [Desulfobacterium sp.]|nr:diguanylate cyclase [Desulfobacterium sp.]
MKEMRYIAVLVLILSNLASIGLPAPVFGLSSEMDSVRLQLNWVHQFEYAGYYAALEKGFYRQEGLDVTILSGGPGIVSVERVTHGGAEYGTGNSEFLLSRLKGKSVVALAVIFQHSPAVILSRADSKIFSPQDLMGKKVEMGQMVNDAETYAVLNYEGISVNQFQLLDSTFNPENIINGSVDAVSAYVTNQPFIMKERNIAYSLIVPRKYGVDYYGNSLFASGKEVKKHPERVEAFKRASLRGWKYAFDHSDEIIDLILSKYSGSRYSHSQAHLAYERDEMKKLILPDLVELGHMNPGRWKHMADTFVRLGLVENPDLLEGFMYAPRSGAFNWSHRGVRAAIAVFLFVLTAAFTLIYFNGKLKGEIRQRTRAEEELKKNKERLDLVMWGANLGYWYWDTHIRKVALGFNAAEMLDEKPESVQGPVMEWATEKIHPEDRSDFRDIVMQHVRGELPDIDLEHRVRTRNGEYRWVLCRGKITDRSTGGDPLRAAGTLMDISRLKDYQKQLEELSIRDPLTGLYNRRYYLENLENRLSRVKRDMGHLSLAIIDIDFFKKVNDTYGHVAGDHVLSEFASLIVSLVRPDDIPARYGGEEFAIIFSDISAAEAGRIVSRIRKSLADTILTYGGETIGFTFSCGISDTSEFQPHEISCEKMITKADERLYQGKNTGRDRIVLPG